jgi:biotin-(acetyl-CoA carboxylase) ligase
MWRKGTWGMIGWFELSYHALTSALHGDRFYIGTREGRLLSIKRGTNETSSWPLHKSEITVLWSNGSVVCSGTKKDAPVVWTRDLDTAPTELAVLDKTDRSTVVTGNSQFVMVGLTSGDVKLWDIIGWNHIRTLESQTDEPLDSMWANDLYLITSSTAGFLTIWDLKKDVQLGQVKKNGVKYGRVVADHDLIYVASSEGLVVIGISLEEHALDLCNADNRVQDDHLLKTSPYDVLESVLSHQSQGDNSLQEKHFSKAMEKYDTALQLLVDNVHALQAVPEEREKLTREISSRRSKASLRSKIESIQSIDKEIEQISDELDLKGQTLKDESEVDSLWKVNQAIALTHGMENEWRWMEQRRTSLSERKGFLERTIKQLEKELANAESDSEVQEILKGALDKHKQLHEQIGRIISASDDEQEAVLSSREDALAAIHGLLGIMPKKRNAMLAISDHTKRQKELERLTTALEEALESAKSHGLKEETRSIQNEIESVASLNGAARTENA